MLNPAHLDLQSLRLFLRIARLGSLTKAAEESSLTLSALSKRLSELEKLIGMPLVMRHRRGITLTPAGADLEHHARALDIQVRRLASDMNEYAKGAKGCVQVWANPAAVIQFLPDSLARFQADSPLIRIQLKEELSGQIAVALRSGEADIGIFAANVDHSGLHTQDWRSDQLVALIPRDHPLARDGAPLRFAELLDYDFVGLNAGSALLRQLEDAAEAAGSVLRLRIQVTSFEAVGRMVEAGLGISVLPAGGLRQGEHRYHTRAIAEAWAARHLLIGLREGGQQQPEVARLFEHLTRPAD
jgi:DNA-binding transcriptional LysR family regulator